MMTPNIVCLCGSTRFKEAFELANFEETMKGSIVLSVGFYHHASLKQVRQEDKEKLDILHFRKIDLAHEILVLNVDGYIGYSTKREIAYALGHQTKVRFLDEKTGEEYLEKNTHELGRLLAELVDWS
jgi:hypothetical protein